MKPTAYHRWFAVLTLTVLVSLAIGCRKTTSRVSLLDAPGAAELRANATGHPRLIHFWATTCPPCVAEFPQLTTLAGELKAKGVEFVTISFDEPGDQSKV
ncbi:MAG TPA: TlpA disulfide reductase family protein, partial [Luteolibacter sp.]